MVWYKVWGKSQLLINNFQSTWNFVGRDIFSVEKTFLIRLLIKMDTWYRLIEKSLHSMLESWSSHSNSYLLMLGVFFLCISIMLVHQQAYLYPCCYTIEYRKLISDQKIQGRQKFWVEIIITITIMKTNLSKNRQLDKRISKDVGCERKKNRQLP